MPEDIQKPKVLIALYDDTTVFMAMSFIKECERLGLDYTVAQVLVAEEVQRLTEDRRILTGSEYLPHISERQLSAVKQRAKSLVTVNENVFSNVCALYDIVLVTKIPAVAIKSLYRNRAFHQRRKTVLVAFSSGLDATPDWTIFNRAYADLMMANSPFHQKQMERVIPFHWIRRPKMGIGHPFFARRSEVRMKRWDDIKNIYFLHQSISPSNPVTRQKVFAFLAEWARAYPDKNIIIKLRHKAGENKKNVNKELFSPQEYFESHERPTNLTFDASPFLDTVSKADLYVSVSSSGIVEGMVHGVMSLFVEGFAGEEQDVRFRQVVDDFRDAKIVATSSALLLGRLPDVNMASLRDHFCSASYFDEMIEECCSIAESPSAPGRQNRINHAPLHVRAKRAARNARLVLRGLLKPR